MPPEAGVAFASDKVLTFCTLAAVLAIANHLHFLRFPSVLQGGGLDVAKIDTHGTDAGAQFTFLIHIQVMHVAIADCADVTGADLPGVAEFFLVNLLEFQKFGLEFSVTRAKFTTGAATLFQDRVAIKDDVVTPTETQDLHDLLEIAEFSMFRSHDAGHQGHPARTTVVEHAGTVVVESVVGENHDRPIALFAVTRDDDVSLWIAHESVLDFRCEAVTLQHDFHGQIVKFAGQFIGDEFTGCEKGDEHPQFLAAVQETHNHLLVDRQEGLAGTGDTDTVDT